MVDSILTSTKKILGISEADTSFDLDIVTHINSVLSTLNQLGVGPEAGFMIEDAEATWTQLIGTDARYSSVKTYVFLKVRMIFDPPTTAHMIAAVKEQIQECEWRINAYRESNDWVDPLTEPIDFEEGAIILEGGNA